MGSVGRGTNGAAFLLQSSLRTVCIIAADADVDVYAVAHKYRCSYSDIPQSWKGSDLNRAAGAAAEVDANTLALSCGLYIVDARVG